MSYPFEFEKSFLAKSDYDAYFLDNPATETFALILKDNKKADYLLLDKNFKILSSISQSIENSIMDNSKYDYIGGSANDNKYYYLYHNFDKDFFEIETVDFKSKRINHQQLLSLPKEEDFISVFSYNNNCYLFSVENKTNQLIIRVMNNNGKITEKSLAFSVPEAADKKKLDEYLRFIQVFKEDEKPDFSAAVRSKKLFCTPGELKIVINSMDDPTHIYSIRLPDLSFKEQFIQYNDIIGAKEKGKVYVNSYFHKDVLYSLVLNKENIRVTLHDLKSGGKFISSFEMNEDQDNYAILATPPVNENRYGKQVVVDDVKKFKHLVKYLNSGREGVMVHSLTNSNLIVKVGTYDVIPVDQSSRGGFENRVVQTGPYAGSVLPVYNPMKLNRPGLSITSGAASRYFNSVYFKYMLNPVTLKPAKGRVTDEIGKQIKDYIETVDKKARAKNQFAIGKNQYYGYYLPEQKTYIIEQKTIR